jgi:hypothetical protein
MGWFDSAEEEKAKKITQQLKTKIAKEGVASLIDEKDLMRVIIEQNHALIGLMTANTIANSGMVGDAVAITHQSLYYATLERYIKS